MCVVGSCLWWCLLQFSVFVFMQPHTGIPIQSQTIGHNDDNNNNDQSENPRQNQNAKCTNAMLLLQMCNAKTKQKTSCGLAGRFMIVDVVFLVCYCVLLLLYKHILNIICIYGIYYMYIKGDNPRVAAAFSEAEANL